MILLKGLAIILFLIYLFYRIGVLYKKIIKHEDNGIITTVLYGFITNYLMFEVLNIPFIFYYKHSTKILYILFLVFSFIMIILSYIIKIKEKKYNFFNFLKEKKESKKSFKRENIIYCCLAIGIIFFQVASSTFMFKQDADDSFYVSWAKEASELENMYDMDPSTGLENSKFNYIYIFNTWEIYNGFIARLANINVATIMHTIIQVLYIPLSYCTYYLMLKRITKKKNIGFSFFVFALLMLFTGISAKFKAAFLLGRIHQGKSIFVNIIIPLSIYELLDYKKINANNIITISNIYISSMAFTPMTLSLLSLLYGLFLVMILVKREYKSFFKMLTILIPVVIVGGIYVLTNSLNSNTINESIITNNFSQKNELVDFIGSGKGIVILYIISLFIIFIKGTEKQKELSIYLPVIMLILVFNPILTTIYIRLVTSSTYWRLFWLIPIEFTIVIAITIIYDIITKKQTRYIYTIFIISLIIISGKYIYSEERGFSKFQTIEKIPQYIIDEANYISTNIDNKNQVIAPPEPWEACMLRQYSTKIDLMYSRSLYENINPIEDDFKKTYNKLYYNTDEEYNDTTINELFFKYNAKWIIIPKDKKLKQIENSKYYIDLENEKNYILKIKE